MSHTHMLAVVLSVGALTAAGYGDTEGVGPSPLIQYLFNDGTAGVATNSGALLGAGNGVLNGPQYSADTPSGSGFSISFDGSDDFIRVNNIFSYGAAATVECWIKPDDVTGQNCLWDDYGNPGVLFTVVNGRLQWNISTLQHPGGGIGMASGVLTAGTWKHVAGTYDGTAIRSFINGVEVGCTMTTGAIIENGAAPALGSDNVTTNALNYDGKIDDFRVWNISRSVAELSNGEFAGAARSADLSGDGVVDGADIGQLLASWGPCTNVCCSADLNRDGVVDGADLGMLLAQWTT